MKSQVKGHLVLGGGVDCSPLSAGVPNISSNTAQPDPGGLTWHRFWNAARDAAGLPDGFTPYNARHTGISWAIDKGVDLQKVRQRAGHGSLEVTSRYAAILDDRDTSLADALEEVLDDPCPAVAAVRSRES